MGIHKGTKLTDNPKDMRIQLRLTKEEHDKLHEIMKRDNMTISEVVRKGIELQA